MNQTPALLHLQQPITTQQHHSIPQRKNQMYPSQVQQPIASSGGVKNPHEQVAHSAGKHYFSNTNVLTGISQHINGPSPNEVAQNSNTKNTNPSQVGRYRTPGSQTANAKAKVQQIQEQQSQAQRRNSTDQVKKNMGGSSAPPGNSTSSQNSQPSSLNIGPIINNLSSSYLLQQQQNNATPTLGQGNSQVQPLSPNMKVVNTTSIITPKQNQYHTGSNPKLPTTTSSSNGPSYYHNFHQNHQIPGASFNSTMPLKFGNIMSSKGASSNTAVPSNVYESADQRKKNTQDQNRADNSQNLKQTKSAIEKIGISNTSLPLKQQTTPTYISSQQVAKSYATQTVVPQSSNVYQSSYNTNLAPSSSAQMQKQSSSNNLRSKYNRQVPPHGTGPVQPQAALRNSGSGSKSSSSQKNMMNKTQKINSNLINGVASSQGQQTRKDTQQQPLQSQVQTKQAAASELSQNENVTINQRQNHQMLTSRNSSTKNLYKTTNDGGSKSGASFSNTPQSVGANHGANRTALNEYRQYIEKQRQMFKQLSQNKISQVINNQTSNALQQSNSSGRLNSTQPYQQPFSNLSKTPFDTMQGVSSPKGSSNGTNQVNMAVHAATLKQQQMNLLKATNAANNLLQTHDA